MKHTMIMMLAATAMASLAASGADGKCCEAGEATGLDRASIRRKLMDVVAVRYGRDVRDEILADADRAFATHFDDDRSRKANDPWMKPDMGAWQGEFWGKYMLAGAEVAEHIGDEELKTWLREKAADFVRRYQQDDGYLCSYADREFLGGPYDPRCRFAWNIWGRKYTMWALLEIGRIANAPELVEAARRMADQLIAQLDRRGLSLRETGYFAGLPSCSILIPMVRLYKATGDRRYLDYAGKIVREWDREDGAKPNLIRNALGDKPVHEWYPEDDDWPKAYEMMSCLEGVLEYAQVVGGAEGRMLCEAVTRMRDKLASHEYNEKLGSVGDGDKFHGLGNCGKKGTEHCDVVHWMRLNAALYRATGDAKAPEFVRKAYNGAFLAGILDGGRWCMQFVKPDGSGKPADLQVNMKRHHCCVDNMPRGFVVAESMAVAKPAATYETNWESLSRRKVPEWYENAKFGIFCHWGVQCAAEDGDWYARRLYDPGHEQGRFHREKFGDPKEFGAKDLIPLWKAENWNPNELCALYRKMGATFILTLANHHDNFDNWNSAYQPWNSVNMGPKRDVLGEWRAAALKNGLRFGASFHASHAWTWYEIARDYDGLATKADGIGKWWEGYDPQMLYWQNHEPSPGYRDLGLIFKRWEWGNGASSPSDGFIENFRLRVVDAIAKYKPDLVYFDDTVVPFYPIDEVGLRILADYYNVNPDGVATGKVLDERQRRAMVWDVERGTPPAPMYPKWQTDTCIGEWHYDRKKLEKGYKSAADVLRMLVDVVSKNGNLCLSIPIKSDGTIDDKERKVCEDIAEWMAVNRAAFFDTVPYEICGEGPQIACATPLRTQGFNESRIPKPTKDDVRYLKARDGSVVFAVELAPDGTPPHCPVLESRGMRLSKSLKAVPGLPAVHVFKRKIVADDDKKSAVARVRCDVAVVGGGSAGFAAAWSAANRGADVVLVEREDVLGGTSTVGGVCSWEPVCGAEGLPELVYERLKGDGQAGVYRFAHHISWSKKDGSLRFPGALLEIDGDAPYSATLRRHGPGMVDEKWFRANCRGVIFDPDAMSRTMSAILKEAGRCQVMTGTEFVSAECKDGRISSLRLSNGVELEPKVVIDACGAVARQVGCDLMRSDRPNGASLIYRVSRSDGAAEVADPPPCWWAKDYPLAFCVTLPNGEVSVNMLPTMSGEEVRRMGEIAAYEEARRRVAAHWRWMQAKWPAFTGWRICRISPRLALRETFRVRGDYVLTGDDVRQGVRPQDEIASADHALDSHGGVGFGGELKAPYGIPYRCLIASGFDNMLVAGRIASFDSVAATSCRLSRTMMKLGEAAGAAAAIAVREGKGIREVKASQICGKESLM